MGGTVGRLWCPGGAMPTDEEQALLGDSKKTDDPVAVKEVNKPNDLCSRACATIFNKAVANFLLAALTFFGFMGVSAAVGENWQSLSFKDPSFSASFMSLVHPIWRSNPERPRDRSAFSSHLMSKA